MKKIVLTLLVTFLFIGCGSKESSNQPVEAKLVLNKSLSDVTINDQHEVPHTISTDIKTVIFAFSKDVGHNCNEFFASKAPGYLQENNALFVADVSGAPSLIRSMFIMPGLKDFKHTVLVMENAQTAAAYKSGLETDKIVLVSLENGVITDINSLATTQELEKTLQTK